MAVTVGFYVDWDKDGNYTDESAFLKANGLTIRRGRPNIMDGGGFTPMSPADVWGQLSNVTNRYDPFNTSSAIYPYVLPGRPCYISATSGATTHRLFTGWLSDVRANGAQSKVAVFRASDGLQYLNMQECETRAQADETVAVALGVLVDQSDWPVALGSSIDDNGDSVIDWEPDTSQTLYEEMQEFADAFGGTIFISAEGGFQYRMRDSNQDTVLELDDTEIQREFDTTVPWDEIYNDIRIEGRAFGATSVNSTSITDYGRRTAHVGGGTNDYIQSAENAANLADWILEYGELVKKPLKVKLVNSFTEQFSLDIMDRVQITLTDYGINALYLIGYIEHRFMSRGLCETTFYLEPYRAELLGQTYPMTFSFTLSW